MLTKLLAASAVLLSFAGTAQAQYYYYPTTNAPVYAAPAPQVYYSQPVYAQPAYAQPVYAQPAYVQPVYAAPVYAQPYYYGRGYYSPFSIGLNFNIGGGHHWR